jgi:hypothetical protein
VINNYEHIVLKDMAYEKLADWLWGHRYQLLDSTRVQILEICQNLSKEQSANLYHSLKTDLDNTSPVDKDAAPWYIYIFFFRMVVVENLVLSVHRCTQWGGVSAIKV